MIKSSRNNYDNLPAEANTRERNFIIKQQVKKLKSPDTKKMLSLEVPQLRATFYFNSKEKMNKKIKQFKKIGIICSIMIFLLSCKKESYCWQCESKIKKSITYIEVCDKSEPEIRQFEKDYTHPGPVVSIMKCKLKID